MKLIHAKAVAIVVAAFLSSAPVFAQVDIADLQSGAEDFSDALAKALPFNSTVGLNWSDAYIGQIVGIPPHFGVGIVMGATSIDAADASALLDQLGYSSSDLGDMLPLPAIAAEARIGGFLLPFDIGLKVGLIPTAVGESLSSAAGGLNVDYLLFGADLRYALLKGGLVLPAVSVGVGVNYMKGGVSTSVGDDQTIAVEGTPVTLYAPEVGLEWETTTFDLKAQISKGFIIFTPYAGIGASYGLSKAGYHLTSDTNLTQTEIDALNDYLDANGQAELDISDEGFTSTFDVTGWSMRAFGGLSVNLLVLKLDLTGMYNLSDGSYGATVGARFQL